MHSEEDGPWGERARRVLACNLKMLLDYYKAKGGKPGTGVALEQISGVGNSTISRYTLGHASANLTDLSKIAAAYDLKVWQLLYPGLDPANPPKVKTGTDEEAMRQTLEAALKLLAQQGEITDGSADQSDAGTAGGRPTNRSVSGTSARSHPKRTKT